MSLPKTFRRAVFKEAGARLTIESVNLTLPPKGEVLVKVEASGVCHSDVLAQNNAMGGGFPLVPGHEIIGRVVAIHDGETVWKVGDRIGGGWHGGHDGTCKACRKGYFQMCDNEVINGQTRDGGFAEYCTLRSEAGIPIPEHVDGAKYAPILCAGVTVFNSMRRMNMQPGSTVAIQGIGGLGHLAIQYANKFGFRVVAISRDSQKEKFARQLGAHEYIDASKCDVGEALQKLGGANMIIANSPCPDTISPLMNGLAILGKLLILAVAGDVPVSTPLMILKGLSVVSWPSGHALDSEEAIEFSEIADIDCLVEKFPLEKVNDAWDAMINSTVRFRAVIMME